MIGCDCIGLLLALVAHYDSENAIHQSFTPSLNGPLKHDTPIIILSYLSVLMKENRMTMF